MKECMKCPIAKFFTPDVLLRVGLGILMLFAGIGKFKMGFVGVANGMSQPYDQTILPVIVAKYFLLALPFIEIILGAWLLSGFMKKSALAHTGILFLIFIVGLLLKSDMNSINQIFVYLLVTAAAMKMSCCGECDKK